MAFKYDVFISFRGEDTRYNFIGFLHKELFRKGISAFVDDKDLKIGQGISPSLSEAIEESKILLVVFSQNYASSMWCLDELVKIIDCSKRNNSKQLVFPIFYHVDPSHIRHQRNEYGKAMTEHKERFGEGSQRVQAWISALSEAANFPGQHITGAAGLWHWKDVIEVLTEDYAGIEIQGIMLDPPERQEVVWSDTAIKELPNSIGKLTGLVSIEMPSSKKLTNLPNSLFTLPNFVAIKIGGSLQLRESFRRMRHKGFGYNWCLFVLVRGDLVKRIKIGGVGVVVA
ncbi:hypothetical protein RJT34_11012 [Clitoria ternatea]|uniref:ADP-ribosyl cyclase/cyclic ADP-ribose hydrolase n=1 Tax=Clitoria ternatea TaxID=43366 RepID=A0AAN9JJ55_CLITE